jgi:outer membrane immunogenic protein
LRQSTLENEDSVSTWPVLGSGGSDAVGYGGFVGYNTQWQDLVLGLEGNYTHTAFSMSAGSTPISRSVTAGGNPYNVNLTGTGQLEITDYASPRARAGWALGNFLPYGFSVGGGLDWALTQNIFLRGEFEYVQFAPIANIVASILSARVGAGFKF